MAISGPSRMVVKLADVDRHGRFRLISGGGIGTGPRVRLDPTAYRVPAGHRLRVAVSGGSFPRLWPATMPVGGVGSVTLALRWAVAGKRRRSLRHRPALWQWHEPLWEIQERPAAVWLYASARRTGEPTQR